MSEFISVLDAGVTGHHREYLGHLCEAVVEENLQHRVVFYVRNSIREELILIPGVSESCIRTLPDEMLDPEDHLRFVLTASGKRRTKIFFPRINGYVKALLRLGDGSVQISGIWFNPRTATICYSGGTFLQRLAAWLEVSRMKRLKRQCGLRSLYLLNDERTADFLSGRLDLKGGVRPLADPIPEWGGDSEGASISRGSLGIDPSTKVLGLFGAMREGKGVEDFFEALDGWCPPGEEKISVLVAGMAQPAFKSRFDALVRDWEQRNPSIQLFVESGFQTNERFRHLISLVDFLVLPYRNVFGSSGLLGHAAAAGKPVVASRRGLLGHLVEEFSLGVTVEPRHATEFRNVLIRACQGDVGIDGHKAREYMARNSVASFCSDIVKGDFFDDV